MERFLSLDACLAVSHGLPALCLGSLDPLRYRLMTQRCSVSETSKGELTFEKLVLSDETHREWMNQFRIKS